MARNDFNLNEVLKNNRRNMEAFMRSSLIARQPSTKVRDRYKRRRVIAIEMALIEKNFDPTKFKRVVSGRFNGQSSGN